MKAKLFIIAAVTILSFGAIAPSAQALPANGPWYQPRPNDHRPLLMAHQGGEGEHPSNTMLAFTKATQAKADVLDTDMLVTSNGVPVLFHDETLDYRTNGTGYVRDYSLAQLRQLDFAHDWTIDGGATYPFRGQGIKVVTVEELLQAFPTARIGIEIKQVPEQAVRTLCTLIRTHNATGRVLVSSSTQPNMNAFRAACPTVATSATQDEVVQFFAYNANNNFPTGYNPPFSSIQAPETFSGIPVLTSGFVARAHQYNLKVYAWTIETIPQAQRLIETGVDGLNVNHPKRMHDWLGSPLKVCASQNITYKLTTPAMQGACVWTAQAWLNEARDKYNQESNPSWVVLPDNGGVYNAQTKEMVTLWQYMTAGQLPLTGEANSATFNSMSLACVAAQTDYAYNSSFC